MNFRFPAVFNKEDDGYNVDFPDLIGGYTCGIGIPNSIYMAKDLLRTLMIYNYYNVRDVKPSSVEELKKKYPNDLIIMINVNIADRYLK